VCSRRSRSRGGRRQAPASSSGQSGGRDLVGKRSPSPSREESGAAAAVKPRADGPTSADGPCAPRLVVRRHPSSPSRGPGAPRLVAALPLPGRPSRLERNAQRGELGLGQGVSPARPPLIVIVAVTDEGRAEGVARLRERSRSSVRSLGPILQQLPLDLSGQLGRVGVQLPFDLRHEHPGPEDGRLQLHLAGPQPGVGGLGLTLDLRRGASEGMQVQMRTCTGGPHRQLLKQ
jgi:hypothetical protein